jgi:pimeloyl-[acyl-carrier protein] methyl ester esterase
LKTALVLLPGLDGTGTLFSNLIPALDPEFEPIIVRYPPDVPLGYAESEATARQSLPGGRPFILLAESFSGPIAISIGASAPAGLAGLVLCGSFASCPRPYLAKLWPLLRRLPIHSASQSFLSKYFAGKFSSQELHSALEKARRSVAEEVLKARIAAVCAADFSSELGRVRVPILYLRASQDRIVPRTASEKIKRLAPSARIVDIEGPHYMLQACSSVAADAIRGFALEIGVSA